MRDTDSAVAGIMRAGGCAIASGAAAATISRRVTGGCRRSATSRGDGAGPGSGSGAGNGRGSSGLTTRASAFAAAGIGLG